MPARQRDARLALARLVARLEQRSQLVTLADLERAARRSSKTLPAEGLPALIETAVADELLLSDRRTFFDRATTTFRDGYVYRVNWRHPLLRGRG
jgi:hypothetical protein